jgi:hypothetical protein
MAEGQKEAKAEAIYFGGEDDERLSHDSVVVAEALGKDPDALIAEFAAGWLAALRERIDA